MTNSITITQGENAITINVTSAGNLAIGTHNFDPAQITTNNVFDKYAVANRNYVDERFKLNYSDKYWRTVSDKLFSTDPNIEYIAKIQEVVLSKNTKPLRLEYDILEIQTDPNTIDRSGNHKKTYFHHQNIPGSNYIIETNNKWSFDVN